MTFFLGQLEIFNTKINTLVPRSPKVKTKLAKIHFSSSAIPRTLLHDNPTYGKKLRIL